MICIDRHISDKFRDESFSDADVCVVWGAPGVQNAQMQEPSAVREELDRFAGHLLVLTRSPYFQTQVGTRCKRLLKAVLARLLACKLLACNSRGGQGNADPHGNQR